MKFFEGISYVAIGLVFLFMSLKSLFEDYELYRKGAVIDAVVSSEVNCGTSVVRGSLCTYQVEFHCGQSSCSDSLVTPLSMPFTGPRKGETIKLYWMPPKATTPVNFINLWVHNFLMLIFGVASCVGGLIFLTKDKSI